MWPRKTSEKDIKKKFLSLQLSMQNFNTANPTVKRLAWKKVLVSLRIQSTFYQNGLNLIYIFFKVFSPMLTILESVGPNVHLSMTALKNHHHKKQ